MILGENERERNSIECIGNKVGRLSNWGAYLKIELADKKNGENAPSVKLGI